ncbi:hypothetical protein D3C79_658970 [compost metagenome]
MVRVNDGQHISRLGELEGRKLRRGIRRNDLIGQPAAHDLAAHADEADIQVAELQDVGLLSRVLEWDQAGLGCAVLRFNDEPGARAVLCAALGQHLVVAAGLERGVVATQVNPGIGGWRYLAGTK